MEAGATAVRTDRAEGPNQHIQLSLQAEKEVQTHVYTSNASLG